MAWEADIDARPMPIANKETASIFIGISFPLLSGEITCGQMRLRDPTSDDGGGASDGGASDDDASDGDASDGDGDASAPARASSDRLRSATRPPA